MSSTGEVALSVFQRIQNAFSDSIFALQLAYWPLKRASYIQQLPPEIIAEIFTWCLLSENRFAKRFVRSAPFNISAVCRSWRRLALSLSRLWTRFKYLQKMYGHERDVPAVETIGMWLERSRNRPLSFSLGNEYNERGMSFEFEKEDSELFLELNRKILDQQGRWKAASMDYDFEDPHNVVEMDMLNMPLLESLHVRMPTETTSVNIDLSRSRRLQSLSLSCEFNLTLGKVPFTNLTNLNLDYGRKNGRPVPLCANNILMVLQKAPNLEKLSTIICDRVDTSELKIKDMKLPALRKLSIQCRDGGGASIKSILDLFAVPKLKDLTIRADGRLGAVASLGVADLLSRSQVSLTSFDIRKPSDREEEIIRCLRLSPNLVHLTITDLQSNPGNVISALRIPQGPIDDGGILCPKLRTLQFSSDRLRFLFSEFASMIASRGRKCGEGRSRLREVRLREQDTWFIERSAEVRECMKKGLRLIAFDGWERTN